MFSDQTMGSQIVPSPKLHFLLFPIMAQGHLIPMIDLARLLANRGVTVTIVTTPLNANRFKPVLDRSIKIGLPIHITELRFPCAEVGLPEGCENFDAIPLQQSIEMSLKMFEAISLLEEPVIDLFERLVPRPSCIISDSSIIYTTRVAKKFNVPRIVFHGPGNFYLWVMNVVATSDILQTALDNEPVVLQGFPDRFEFTKQQLTRSLHPSMEKLFDEMHEADMASYGVVVNSFVELEPEYAKEFNEARERKVWCIGPVSECNKNRFDMGERGSKALVDGDECIKWLSAQGTASVVYACLGSLCNLVPSQLKELALGLEASGRPFVWVLRGNEGMRELEEWIEEDGFEKRVRGRGMVVRGWAPQVLILSHPSVGGFLTHCGWNSTIEGVSVGVPLLTWPLFGDQFCNEKLVVEVLKIGVKVEGGVPVLWGTEEEVEVAVKREDVERAVERVMDGGEEGEERRRRAKEMAKMAKGAAEEGGSSYLSLTNLIQDIEQLVI